MAENSKIEWTHHTFNPWIGCTKVSPACDNCYAETWDQRYEGGIHWGPKAPRRRTSIGNWNKPKKWDKQAAQEGIRYRVFCASLADVFDNKIQDDWRADLWALIRETKNLDWLLLTKRPQNIAKMLPQDWGYGYSNVWLGTTVENQEEANRRIPHLLNNPAKIRFLSCEPLLGPVDLESAWYGESALDSECWGDCRWCKNGKPALYNCQNNKQSSAEFEKGKSGIDWVITGGESGPNFRAADPEWFRSLRDQCLAAGVPFLFKQWEGKTPSDIKLKGRALDGKIWDQYPTNV